MLRVTILFFPALDLATVLPVLLLPSLGDRSRVRNSLEACSSQHPCATGILGTLLTLVLWGLHFMSREKAFWGDI